MTWNSGGFGDGISCVGEQQLNGKRRSSVVTALISSQNPDKEGVQEGESRERHKGRDWAVLQGLGTFPPAAMPFGMKANAPFN